MSFPVLDPELRRVAETVLTAREWDAVRLWSDGLGYTRIGLSLGISRETARDRVVRASRKLAADERFRAAVFNMTGGPVDGE